jgi:hypothetical protein
MFVFCEKIIEGREEMKKTILCLATAMILFASMFIGLPRVSAQTVSAQQTGSMSPTTVLVANNTGPWSSFQQTDRYFGHSFSTGASQIYLTTVGFDLISGQNGKTPGYLYAELYSISGTYGSGSELPNALLATSSGVAFSTLPVFDNGNGNPAWTNFTFSPYLMSVNTGYAIELYNGQNNTYSVWMAGCYAVSVTKGDCNMGLPWIVVSKTCNQDDQFAVYGNPCIITCLISPSSIILPINGIAVFTCTATGGVSPYTYNWYVNGQLFQSGSTNTYSFTALQQQQATNVTIQCQVTDSANEIGIANAYSYVELPNDKVDIVNSTDSKLGLDAVMYHDWSSATPQYDYWVIEVTLNDLMYKNTSSDKIEIHPWIATITLEMNPWCQEIPTNHLPEQGSYGNSPESISFSYMGIGFSMQGSAYRVLFDEFLNQTTNELVCRWTLEYGSLGMIPTGYPWTDYTQVSIGVRTPVGMKPTVQVGASNIWYAHYTHGFMLLYWYADSDFLYTTLDPPNSAPIAPQNTSLAPSFSSQAQLSWFSEGTETLNTSRPIYFRAIMWGTDLIFNGQYTVVSITSIIATGYTERITTSSVILLGNQSNYICALAVPRAGFAVEE